jgi:hypothetical protein
LQPAQLFALLSQGKESLFFCDTKHLSMKKNLIVLNNIAIGLCCVFIIGWAARAHILPYIGFKVPLFDYVIVILGTGLILIATDYIFANTRANHLLRVRFFESSYQWFCLLLVAYFVLFIADWEIWYRWAPYRKVLYQSINTYLIALIPCMAILLYPKLRDNPHIHTKVIKPFALASIALVCLYMGSFAIFNEFHRYNVNAVNFQIALNPIVQVFLGKGSLIDVRSQYGFYAQFFEPLLKITGLSITSVTSIFALIIISSLFMIGFTLYKTVHNKILAVFGFITLVYFSYFSSTWPYELYFQYHPIRSFFPAIAIFLFYCYAKQPSQTRYYVGLSILSLGIVWNPDVGIFAFVAFMISVCFLELGKQDIFINKLPIICWKVLQAVVVLVLTISIFTLYLRFRYLAWPDYSLLFQGQDAFVSNSSRLVVSQYNVWIIVAASYVAAISLSIRRMYEQRLSIQTAMIFMCCVLGIGLFTYRANNTFPHPLGAVSYPAIIIVLLLTDMGLKHRLTAFYSTGFWGAIRGIRFANPYNYVLLFMTMFFSSMAIVFFGNNLANHDVQNHVKLHELYFPSETNNKPLWPIPGTTKYATVKDFAGEQPTKRRPSWYIRAQRLSRFFEDNEVKIAGEKFIIFSMWDAYLHMKLKVPSAVDMPNAYHASIYNAFTRIIPAIKEQTAKWIIFDTDQQLIIDTGEKAYKTVLNTIEQYYEKAATIPAPDVAYGVWVPSSLLVFHRKDMEFSPKPLPVYSDAFDPEYFRWPAYQRINLIAPNHDSKGVLLTGIANTAEWGTSIAAAKAELSFRAKAGKYNALVIRATGFLTSDYPTTRIQVSLNNKKIGTMLFNIKNNTAKDFTFELVNSELFMDKPNTILFYIDDHSKNTTGDSRILGANLLQLSLQ